MSRRGEASVSRSALGWIIGLGAASFVLSVLMIGFADSLSEPRSSGTDSFSYSALGHRGLVEFLRASGMEVLLRRSERGLAAGPDAVLVAVEPSPPTPPADPAASRLARLAGLAAGRGLPLVVVLPKRRGIPEPGQRGWLRETRLIPLEEVHAAVAALGVLEPDRIDREETMRGLQCETSWGGRVWVTLPAPQLLLDADNLEPLVRCGQRTLVARARRGEGAGDLVLVSDPDLVATHGLGLGDNAAIVHALLSRGLGAATVVLDETIHGFVLSRGLIAELLRFPLVLATAHGAVVLALVGWAGMGRFGSPRAAPPAVARDKAAVLDATAKLLTRAGQEAESLVRYYQQTLRAVGAHFFLPPDLSESRLAATLREVGARRGVAFDPLVLKREVDRLAAGGGRRAGHALELARELHRWREEMSRVP